MVPRLRAGSYEDSQPIPVVGIGVPVGQSGIGHEFRHRSRGEKRPATAAVNRRHHAREIDRRSDPASRRIEGENLEASIAIGCFAPVRKHRIDYWSAVEVIVFDLERPALAEIVGESDRHGMHVHNGQYMVAHINLIRLAGDLFEMTRPRMQYPKLE